MNGFLFISNGRRLTKEQENSLAPFSPGSFMLASIDSAYRMGWKLFAGINRTYPDKIESIGYSITFYNQHIYRNIFDIKSNLVAFHNLKNFLSKYPEINVIHCNTPIGGILGRLCGLLYHKTVIYTVHGFHFYNGAPLINRTLFKLIERWMARYTDILITINQEDYLAAQKFKLKPGGRVEYVPGVGIDTSLYNNIGNDDVASLRSSLHIPASSFVGIVVGDINDNKNVETIIKAVAIVHCDLHLLVCGVGPNMGDLKKLCERLNISSRVHFLGYRKDILLLYRLSDCFIMSSKREGLPRSTMEAMASGLPCIVSNIRGNIDLVDENGGVLVNPLNVIGYKDAIDKLAENENLRLAMGLYNKNKIKQFDISIVKEKMYRIFSSINVGF